MEREQVGGDTLKKRISIEDASKMLEVTPQFLRVALQQGMYDFGFALKTSSHFTYYINANKFYSYLGIKE